MSGHGHAGEPDDEGAFQAFFLAVERRFGQLCGRALVLSPRDVAVAREWFAAGIPVEAVMSGMERFFRGEARRRLPRRGPLTLAYCEQDVVLAAEDLKAARLGGEPLGALGASDDAGVLEAAAKRIEAAAEASERRAERSIARRLRLAAGALRKLAPRLDAERGLEGLERELEALDDRIERALRSGLDERAAAALSQRASERLAAYEGRIAADSLRELVRRAEAHELLERHGLPRLVSLIE